MSRSPSALETMRSSQATDTSDDNFNIGINDGSGSQNSVKAEDSVTVNSESTISGNGWNTNSEQQIEPSPTVGLLQNATGKEVDASKASSGGEGEWTISGQPGPEASNDSDLFHPSSAFDSIPNTESVSSSGNAAEEVNRKAMSETVEADGGWKTGPVKQPNTSGRTTGSPDQTETPVPVNPTEGAGDRDVDVSGESSDSEGGWSSSEKPDLETSSEAGPSQGSWQGKSEQPGDRKPGAESLLPPPDILPEENLETYERLRALLNEEHGSDSSSRQVLVHDILSMELSKRRYRRERDSLVLHELKIAKARAFQTGGNLYSDITPSFESRIKAGKLSSSDFEGHDKLVEEFEKFELTTDDLMVEAMNRAASNVLIYESQIAGIELRRRLCLKDLELCPGESKRLSPPWFYWNKMLELLPTPVMFPEEDPSVYESLRKAMMEEWNPVTPTGVIFVDDMMWLEWDKRRLQTRIRQVQDVEFRKSAVSVFTSQGAHGSNARKAIPLDRLMALALQGKKKSQFAMDMVRLDLEKGGLNKADIIAHATANAAPLIEEMEEAVTDRHSRITSLRKDFESWGTPHTDGMDG